MKRLYQYYIAPLYFSTAFYAAVAVVAVLFVLRFFISWMGDFPFILTGIFCLLTVFDYLLVFGKRRGLFARRMTPDRLSNGDENKIRIDLENHYKFRVRITVIDEIPFQFQKRDTFFNITLPAGNQQVIYYHLRPVKRGEYEFGVLNIYAATILGWVERRYKFEAPRTLPVYPSYLQMRKYQLLALANRLNEIGVRKIRQVGHSMEFEHIRDYVQGDDVRAVNWKATARRGRLMVNHYMEEKSQQVYCVIDKGRVMKMPFDGLSLLDYAINAALVVCNVALLKQDKAGLITFAEKISAFLKANSRSVQMNAILELLYHQKTRYLESDYEKLYINLRMKVTQRSLVVLFTNFETLTALKRQLPYLIKIAQSHLLLVVFFENTELRQLLEMPATDVESVYKKTIAEQFAYEKKLIVKELQQHGILTILTAPESLTINVINKYLEIKARQAI